MQKNSLLVKLAFAAGMLAACQAAQAQETHGEKWEMGVEMGYLKKVRHNSPLDYEIVPTQLVWRTPIARELWNGKNGMSLTIRNRLSVVLETYIEGAEDYYIAFAGSPVLELWSADRKTALFYELGGGSGLINSKNVPGGQGQDFTFNWFTQLGLRHQISKKMTLTGGAYFTHHSNLGMTKPNPGIDVVGLNFGVMMQVD